MIGKIFFGLCAGALLSLALLATSASTAEAGTGESVTKAKQLSVGARQGAPQRLLAHGYPHHSHIEVSRVYASLGARRSPG